MKTIFKRGVDGFTVYSEVWNNDNFRTSIMRIGTIRYLSRHKEYVYTGRFFINHYDAETCAEITKKIEELNKGLR